MSLILFLIFLVLTGLVVGGLARLALPGPDPMTIGQTILVGIGGSLIAGVISALLFSRPAGLFLAFFCTFLIVYGIRRSRGGTLTRPADAGRLRRPR
jgi:uncharacterized membrane protein YeaQ/YmgE (transglycosylase-associated protein family)